MEIDVIRDQRTQLVIQVVLLILSWFVYIYLYRLVLCNEFDFLQQKHYAENYKSWNLGFVIKRIDLEIYFFLSILF